MLRIVAPSDPDYRQRLAALARRTSAQPEHVEAAAKTVIADVRARGDAALRELTARFDKRTLGAIELSKDEWRAQAAAVDGGVRAAIERAAARVRAFHEHEKHPGFELDEGGVRLGLRVDPLERVGIYVPGGTARYPSTVLMTAVPARVAGVKEIVMVTPGPSPETLAAAEVAGVDRVFAIGGAQAIAALAYGTESVPRVDKIVGPGNAYVTAAKRLVYGDVGIDQLAGPTEVVVAADDSADPAHVAADLLAQAEHDTLAVPLLVAVGRAVAERIAAEVERQLALLPRREIAAVAVANQGLAIVVDTAEAAIDVVNLLAAEHAGIALRDARRLARNVAQAGAVFVGHHTPEPVGDYVAGPSHVLPTGGSARFSSPLGVADFLKRTSFIEYSAEALAAAADDITKLTGVEGLDAHGQAVTVRLRRA